MSEIRIEDLDKKVGIENSNIIIVEDNEDTKQASISELKKSFLGDYKDPSQLTFFSSQKTTQLLNSLNISLSSYPTLAQFESLSTKVNNLQSNAGNDNSEIVAARGTASTLSGRFDDERKISDSSYIEKPIVVDTVTSISIGDNASSELTLTYPASSSSRTLSIYSTNVLAHGVSQSTGVSWNGNNMLITQQANTSEYRLVTNNNIYLKKGRKYYLYSNPTFSSNFKDKSNISFIVIYPDNSRTAYKYNYDKVFEFTPEKDANKIGFIFNSSMIVANATVIFSNIMISDDSNLSTYITPSYSTKVIQTNKSYTEKFISPAHMTYSISSGLMTATYKENTLTGNDISSRLNILEDSIIGGIDHCGLLENKGEYIFLNESIINDSTKGSKLSFDSTMKRNSRESLKLTMMDYDSDIPIKFTKYLTSPKDLSLSKYISIQVYADRTFYTNFTTSDGITVMMSSDQTQQNPTANYFYYTIPKTLFVQGWNTIKIRIEDMKKFGSPSLNNIFQFNFNIYSSKVNQGTSIWFNSIIIDQKIKPVILLAFENLYENGFKYQYPLLYSKKIPCTIFANNKTTFTNDTRDKIAALEYEYGWELANFGCNPNKEILYEDDNYRDQYLALKSAKAWLNDNFSSDIISYAAPAGNLRPNTVKILKNLGFKIAMCESDGYCSYLSSEDFSVPMCLISNNTTVDAIKKRIDYAISTGQVLVLYTNDVTEYGDEINAKKAMFESIISYIETKMKSNELSCMTFRDFYRACVD